MTSANPKFPTLTGTKLRALSDALRINIRMLQAQFTAKWRRGRDAWRNFRHRWGERPPATSAEWVQFWQEYARIEDAMQDFQEEVLAIFEDSEGALDQINDIILNNGVAGLDGDPLSSLRIMMAQFDEMVQQLRQ